MKKIILLFISLLFFLGAAYPKEKFTDIDESHYAYAHVNKLHELGIMGGVGNNQFGVGREITRAEFVTALVKAFGWQPYTPSVGSFTDNLDNTKWYYTPVETAYAYGAIDKGGTSFRPGDAITREEMAVMLVKAMGYNALASSLDKKSSQFNDVTANKGYITIAKDFGIIAGISPNQFGPKQTAKREQAAIMLLNTYEAIAPKTHQNNAFYAIRSANQPELFGKFDQLSFGWSRVDFDEQNIFLNTSSKNGNEYFYPQGYEEAVNKARQNGQTIMLMVAVQNTSFENTDLTKYIIANTAVRDKLIQEIIKEAENFDGVVIDFENLRSDSKSNFNLFLQDLKLSLGKKVSVALQPKRENTSYYDGYDFKTISEICDEIILMAHDYNPKSLSPNEMDAVYKNTPPAPLDEVYYALKSICGDVSYENRNKILLQINFGAVQWKMVDGKIINNIPYNPSYDAIYKRIAEGGTVNYHDILGPSLEFKNMDDGTDNIVWYEDERSVAEKIKLAGMFNIKGISIWRLGIVPQYQSGYLDVAGML